MELKYRGICYQASVPSVEAMDTPEQGTFLGARFTRKQYAAVHRAQPTEQLTFLGRRYTR